MTQTREDIERTLLDAIDEKDEKSAEKWLLEKRASGITVNTLRTYCAVFKVLSGLTDKSLAECERKDALRILSDVQDRFKDATIYKHVLRDVLRIHGKESILQGFRINNRKAKRSWQDPEKVLTRQEVAHMVRGASGPRDKAILMILWDTGARNHEIASIQRGDLQEVQVLLKNKDTKIFSLWFQKQKIAGEERRIRLYESSPVVRTWLREHPDPENPQAPLFTSNRPGRPLDPLGTRGIRQVVSRAARMARIDRLVRVHDFRHARATDLKRQGVSDDSLRTFMGWSRDSDMPMRYVSRTEEEQMREVGAKLGFEDEMPRPGPIGDLIDEELPVVSAQDLVSGLDYGALANAIVQTDAFQEALTEGTLFTEATQKALEEVMGKGQQPGSGGD